MDDGELRVRRPQVARPKTRALSQAGIMAVGCKVTAREIEAGICTVFEGVLGPKVIPPDQKVVTAAPGSALRGKDSPSGVFLVRGGRRLQGGRGGRRLRGGWGD